MSACTLAQTECACCSFRDRLLLPAPAANYGQQRHRCRASHHVHCSCGALNGKAPGGGCIAVAVAGACSGCGCMACGAECNSNTVCSWCEAAVDGDTRNNSASSVHTDSTADRSASSALGSKPAVAPSNPLLVPVPRIQPKKTRRRLHPPPAACSPHWNGLEQPLGCTAAAIQTT